MSQKETGWTGLALRVGFVALFLVGVFRTVEAQDAKKILDATGTQGGLVVHVGCGNGKLTAALHAGDGYLVHGLDSDAQNIEQARNHISAQGLYGKVSVQQWTGNHLPYIDNLVNLVVAEDLGTISPEEVLRVLSPGGVAYIGKAGKWVATKKPRSSEIDEWTHFLHDATGNAVAKDSQVGPPRHMQWMAAPTWTRNHHTLASISAVVSTAGRIFYIEDEGPAATMEVPGNWFLVARDAFNGVLLWKQPIPTWAWHRKKFRSGPVQLPRTLIAVEDRVYVPLGMNEPVTALDAATGEAIRKYEGTEGAEEVIYTDGVLLVVTGLPIAEQASFDPARSGQAKFPNQKSVVAIAAETGKEIWRWTRHGSGPVPLTLAAKGSKVFFQSGNGVLCLDQNTGKENWNWSPARAAKAEKSKRSGDGKKKGRSKGRSGSAPSAGWSVSTLVLYEGIVLFADGKNLVALSAADGSTLWNCPCSAGFKSPVDVLVAGGLVWLGSSFAEGRNPRTGEIEKYNSTYDGLWTVGHHHRCYRNKATDRYIMSGKRGIEFLDLVSDNDSRHNWVRGLCQYGIMPCNGLVYAPSHSCGCFMESKLYGFWALAPERESSKGGRGKGEGGGSDSRDVDRLERGPAYGKIPPSAFPLPPSEDWPMLRHDPLRSGSTMVELPDRLGNLWGASIGGRLSAPVVADGTILVANIDEHRVIALDARDGKTKWSFTAGGRVDSPPTVYQGLALFGCADGWVYCLRLSDGELVWRLFAAPEDLKTVALDQLESLWPVHGSVLVQDGVAYFAAGRSSWLDGGIFLYGLDPMTGKIVCQTRVRNEHPGLDAGNESGIATTKIDQNTTDYKTFTAPDRSDAFSMEGATTDILVGDGTSVYLRQLRFDRNCVRQEKNARHLFSTSKLLDDAENHRSHWVLGGGDFSRTPVAYSWIANSANGRKGTYLAVPHGLLMTFDEETVWVVRRTSKTGGSYLLFAESNQPFTADEAVPPDFRKAGVNYKWSVDLPMRPRAMLRAGERLLLGGMSNEIDAENPFSTFNGRRGGLLWVMSTQDGSKISQYELDAPPIWDGIAAANGCLFLSTTDGKVLCLGKTHH